MFFKGSRYEKVATEEITDAKGRAIKYKRVRFIPETAAVLQHRVAERERLDLVAYRYYRDPELFWTLCDANHAMEPEALVEEAGRRLLIPSGQR
jgi:hypothetical protein